MNRPKCYVLGGFLFINPFHQEPDDITVIIMIFSVSILQVGIKLVSLCLEGGRDNDLP